MASDWLGGDNNGASTENEGPTVAMCVSPESSLSISFRKKGQSHPHWHLLPYFPQPLLPASHSYKDPAAQGNSLADSAPRTE